MTTLAVIGVTGRMGQALIRALREQSALRLSGAVASPGSSRAGRDAAAEGEPTGILITGNVSEGIRGASVAVDFTMGSALPDHVRACVSLRVPLLVGTTGYDPAARTQLEEAARTVPVLLASNTSLGIAVLSRLAALAAAKLEGYDAEIFEAHHRGKRDAPSGTALALGEAVAGARGRSLADVAALDRPGGGIRAPDSIGFAVVRSGDIVGEHTVSFAGEGERIEITHRATDRQTFARGALKAAAWLAAQRPGLYGMADVLGV